MTRHDGSLIALDPGAAGPNTAGVRVIEARSPVVTATAETIRNQHYVAIQRPSDPMQMGLRGVASDAVFARPTGAQ
ncbi:MAG: hypothetical protein U9R47_02165 [Actinomycetota bacterium]|nr:hypothetical protein [Actinomycetota bacterium]